MPVSGSGAQHGSRQPAGYPAATTAPLPDESRGRRPDDTHSPTFPTPLRRLDVDDAASLEAPPPPPAVMVTVPQEADAAADAPGMQEDTQEHDMTQDAAPVENIIVRFPREQVEELVNYLITELMDQGMTEEEASEKAAELLDDPESQLVMARELHKPVLSRILQHFYEAHDPESLSDVESQVNSFTGHTEDLVAVLQQRYRFNAAALEDLHELASVVEEEQEWLVVAERSATGTSSRPSSAVSVSARKFLVAFFSKFDEARVLDVNDLLAAYNGRTADLRRVLSDEYAHNKDALSDLTRLRVERADTTTSKDAWLAANARLARKVLKKGFGITSLIDAVGLSSAFRHYVSFWLLVGAVFVLGYSVQVIQTMLLAMFLPQEGRWQSVGLLCCFIPSIFLLGSLLAHLAKVVLSWAFLTPGEYYGDFNFSLISGSNDMPHHLRAVLPPAVRRTFLRLPVSGVLRRHGYMAVLQCALLACPLVYGVARTAVEGRSVLNFFSLVSQWNTAASCAILLALWGFGWCHALAKKAKRVGAAWEAGGAWWRRTSLLREFGLDTPSMGRSVLVVCLTAAVVIIPFWVNTRTNTDIPLPWVIICAAAVAAVLSLREMWRSSLAALSPIYALALLVAFVLIGFVGTAHTSGASVGLYCAVLVLSQCMLLQHRGDHEEGESYITKAVERMASPSDETDVHDATPLKLSKIRRSTADDTPVKVSRMRWVPCHDLLRVLLSYPFSCVRQPKARVNRALPPAKQYPACLDRHTIAFSGKAYIAFMLLVFVCTLCMFHVTASLQSATPDVTGVAVDRTSGSVTMPVCTVRRSTLDIVDMALLAKLSYADSEPAWAQGFDAWFAGRGMHLATPVDTWDLQEQEEQSAQVTLLHVEDAANHSFVVLRSRLEGQLLSRDLQVWSESLLYSALSAVVPVVGWWSQDTVADFVEGVGAIPSAFGTRHGLEDARAFVARLVADGRSVTLVGHGAAGGYARFLGADLAVQAVVFNAPGHKWAGRRFVSSAQVPQEVAVVADRDALGHVDRQSGAVQRLRCASSLTRAECSHVQHTVCSLVAECDATRTFAPAVCV